MRIQKVLNQPSVSRAARFHFRKLLNVLLKSLQKELCPNSEKLTCQDLIKQLKENQSLFSPVTNSLVPEPNSSSHSETDWYKKLLLLSESSEVNQSNVHVPSGWTAVTLLLLYLSCSATIRSTSSLSIYFALWSTPAEQMWFHQPQLLLVFSVD